MKQIFSAMIISLVFIVSAQDVNAVEKNVEIDAIPKSQEASGYKIQGLEIILALTAIAAIAKWLLSGEKCPKCKSRDIGTEFGKIIRQWEEKEQKEESWSDSRGNYKKIFVRELTKFEHECVSTCKKCGFSRKGKKIKVEKSQWRQIGERKT